MKKTKIDNWDDSYYLKAYQLARAGTDLTGIATSLGMTVPELKHAKRKRPALADALDQGWDGKRSLQAMIYRELPEDYKKVWDRITAYEKEEYPTRKIDLLFDKYGERCRKYLFLHAMTTSAHFNPSKACRKVNIAYHTWKKWAEDDAEFANLLLQCLEHKKNFFEEKLFELVDEKDSKAVLFVNKTLNQDRGYAEKLQIEHKGNVSVSHTMELSDEVLDRLSKSCRKELLGVIQEVEELQLEKPNQVLLPKE